MGRYFHRQLHTEAKFNTTSLHVLVCLISLIVVSSASWASTQVAGPTSAYDPPPGDWQNVTGIYNEGGGYTETEHTVEWLFVNGFGFNIPTDATVEGIELRVVANRDTLPPECSPTSNRLYVSVCPNASSSGCRTKTLVPDYTWSSKNLGGSTDLWGTNWTPEQINSSGFSIGFQQETCIYSMSRHARIDYVEVTVYFSQPDTTAPAITCPPNVTIEAGESEEPSNTGQATATDTNDPSPTVTYSDSRAGSCPEVITRTWTAEDDCGNTSSCIQTITVEDTTAPVISCPADVAIEAGESENPSHTGQATAEDDCDRFPRVSYSDERTGTCPVQIIRTWTAVDNDHNRSVCQQIITMLDTTAPSISCPGDVLLAAGESEDPARTGIATASDAGDPSPVITYTDQKTGTCPTRITRTWIAIDSCGNKATCVQTITVLGTAPDISNSPERIVEVGTLYLFRPDVADGCKPHAYGIRNQPSWASFNIHNGRLVGTPSPSDVGTYGAIEISVTDSSGQSDSTGEFTIVVIPKDSNTFSQTYLNLPTHYVGNGYAIEIENSLVPWTPTIVPREDFFSM